MKKIKNRKNEYGGAMLLALFTVIVLAAVATAFFSITVAESKTTGSRIDSELALEMATAGLEYVALVASVQTNTIPSFWTFGTTRSEPNFSENRIFAPAPPPTNGYQLVFNLESPDTPRDVNQFLRAEPINDGQKMAGFIIILPPSQPSATNEMLVTSIGYVAEGNDPDRNYLSDPATVFQAARVVQGVLKETSFMSYAYLYRNIVDLDLAFNLPLSYSEYMKNMVGFTPDTNITGGIRVDGVEGDPAETDRVARMLIWDENGNPVTNADDGIAQIDGVVTFASTDQYDGTGPDVEDHMIGNYKLNSEMKEAFLHPKSQFGAEQRGIPGANPQFIGSIQTATGFTYQANNTDINDIEGALGDTAALSINNSEVCQAETADNEDLDDNGEGDWSKNICKLSFSIDGDGKTVVDVTIANRYNDGVERDGDLDSILGGGQITSQQYTLEQGGGVIYVHGGNVMVEGEITSGVTVVCDDARTDRTNVDSGSVDSNILDTLIEGVGGTPSIYNENNTRLSNYSQEAWDFFRTMENNPAGMPASEGNVFISGDVNVQDSSGGAIGIVSEHYMYLHDTTATGGAGDDRTFNVQAQVNSIRQSTQFDFFNYLRDDDFAAANEGYYGQFNFKGQMIGSMVDVEGDVAGRGYVSDGAGNGGIDIENDLNLNYNGAPMFFNEDYREVNSGTLKFSIVGLFDLGSLSVK